MHYMFLPLFLNQTTGRYRLSIKKPPIRLNTTASSYLSLPTIGHGEVCVRIIDGSMKVQHEGQQVQNRRLYLRNGENAGVVLYGDGMHVG